MNVLSRLAVASLAATTIAIVGCKPAESPENAAGAGAAAGGERQTAAVADNGMAGNYTGTLNKGGTSVASHPVIVMTDGAGAPQVGFWEFCNVDMVAEGSGYVAKPGSSCLVDLGDGTKPHNITTGSASFGENSVDATITFENGTVWTYNGTR